MKEILGLCDRKSYSSVENLLSRELVDGAVLLCSETKPEKCHRRLVAEYLVEKWGGAEIVHL